VPIPNTLADLTAETMNEALANVIGSDNTITEVTVDRIAEDAGVLGALARVSLGYREANDRLPATVIAKIQAEDEAARQIGMGLNIYQREADFYAKFAPDAQFATPTCYASLADPAAGRWLLVLEDLVDAEPADQLAGISVENAETVIDVIAGFHAQWWASPALADLDWIPAQDDPMFPPIVKGMLEGGLAGIDRYGDLLTDQDIDLVRRFDANHLDLIARTAAGPWTVTHGDLRADNIFFDRATGDPILIDFQQPTRTRGAYDIAWLLGSSMDIELQVEHTPALLQRYIDALAGHGVEYALADLETAVAEHAIYLLSGPISLLTTFEFGGGEGGRSAQLTPKWVRRGFHFAHLMGADDLI